MARNPWLPWVVVALVIAVPLAVISMALVAGARTMDLFGASMAIPALRLGDLLVRSVGLGVMAMAAIQTVRGFCPIRGVFHEWLVKRWFQPGIDAAEQLARNSPVPWQRPLETDLMDPLIAAATSSTRRTFFDMPLEQLCGQLAAAAEQLVDDAERVLRPGIFGSADEIRAVQQRAGVIVYTLAGLVGPAGAGDVFSYASSLIDPLPGTSPGGDAALHAARSALAFRIQRNIDALQIWGGLWWRRSLRVAAFLLCAAMAWGLAGQATRAGSVGGTPVSSGSVGAGVDAVTHYAAAGPLEPPRDVSVQERLLFTLVYATLGGFVATVARDLVAVVEKARR